jgi:hypothetical protein
MILCAEHGLRFAKEGDHWRCVEHPGLVMLRGDRYQLNDATLATGSLSLKGVGIAYILRCGKTAAGPHQLRKRLMSLGPSSDGANFASL